MIPNTHVIPNATRLVEPLCQLITAFDLQIKYIKPVTQYCMLALVPEALVGRTTDWRRRESLKPFSVCASTVTS